MNLSQWFIWFHYSPREVEQVNTILLPRQIFSNLACVYPDRFLLFQLISSSLKQIFLSFLDWLPKSTLNALRRIGVIKMHPSSATILWIRAFTVGAKSSRYPRQFSKLLMNIYHFSNLQPSTHPEGNQEPVMSTLDSNWFVAFRYLMREERESLKATD